jgi:hypothetical protein
MRSFARPANLLLLALALPASLAAAAEPQIVVEPVAPGVRWDAPQAVQADAKGNVFVLRADLLEVFPVASDGSFGEPEALFEEPVAGGAPATRAVMVEPGEWLVRQGYEVRWFRNGKELPLPPSSWPVTSIAALDGRPVAAVVPSPMGRPAPGQARSALPVLVELGRERWSPVVEADDAEADRPRAELMQRHSAHLVADSHDRLWVAQQYRYLVQSFSAAGRPLLEISVDGDRVAHRGEEGGTAARAALERSRTRLADGERASVQVNTAVPVIQGLAEGRDGRYYWLVHGEGEGRLALSLDRYDPIAGTLDRIPLPLDVRGVVTMAGGRDGLHLAAFNAKNGRWRIAWQDLEAATWAPVEGARINGIDLPPRQAEQAPERARASASGPR